MPVQPCYTWRMSELNPSLRIDEKELHFDFIRASGPGGQNVNKVATSVQLRLDVRNSPSLEPNVKERLIKLAGSRMTDEGILIIEAKRFRTQEQNRADALARLLLLIHKASIQPRVRRATRPSLSAKMKRVASKKKRGVTKQARRIHPSDLE